MEPVRMRSRGHEFADRKPYCSRGGGRGESAGVEDPLAPEVRLTGLEARPAWGPLESPAVARGTPRTHPLLLTAADGHRGGGRGTVPELGGLPGSQQAPGEPAGPLASHAPPRCWLLGPAPERMCPAGPPAAPACSTHPPFRKRNSEPFPPSSPLNSQEAGFSRAHPHSAHPLLSRSSSAATLQTLRHSRRAANSARLRRICSGSPGTRVRWLHPRRPPGTRLKRNLKHKS
ncbi:immediate early response gene 5-like protein [Onychomys torridus]|uniref:immediate early response gene 5-like protein n=1 Tax=Onychomys torridus TaxID=38674 RepID=UPI00167F5EA9|nr:immediate early response gene 5-like protein [Onychomys torridus]